MTPVSITYHSSSKLLELVYEDGRANELSAEMLRVYSPSAEVRGHSDADRVLQTGKKYVEIDKVEAVGNYAIRIVFSDGHDTGIYSWEYLQELSDNFEDYWKRYLNELDGANASRLPTIPVGQYVPPKQS